MSTTHAVYESDGPLATLTFNRPEARNAMTWEMYQALVDACDRADDDPAVRVLILRGAGGKAFVAGTDIAQFQSFRDPEDGIDYEQRIDRGARPARTRHEADHRAGPGRGGGRRLRDRAACDLRVATPESTFGIPDRAHARATASRARPAAGWWTCSVRVSSRTCCSPAASSRRRKRSDSGSSIASSRPRTSTRPSVAVRASDRRERAADDARDEGNAPPHHGGPPPAAGEDQDLITMCYTSQDFREGIAAFLAKRPPKWTGT